MEITESEYDLATQIGGYRLRHLLSHLVDDNRLTFPATSTLLLKCRGVSVNRLRQLNKLGVVLDGELDGLGTRARAVLCEIGVYTVASVIDGIKCGTLHTEIQLRIGNYADRTYKRIKKWCGFPEDCEPEIPLYCSLCGQKLKHQRRSK